MLTRFLKFFLIAVILMIVADYCADLNYPEEEEITDSDGCFVDVEY